MAKQKTMTERERIERLLNREKPDRIPIWPFAAGGFAVVHSQISLVEAYTNPEVCLAAQRKVAQEFGWVSAPFIGYAGFGGWEFGGEMKFPTGEFDQAPSISRYAVDTTADVMNLAVPDIKESGFVPVILDFCHKASKARRDNEPFRVMSTGCGSFSIACNIAGPDKLARWIIKEPDAAHRLLRLATDFVVALAGYWKDVFGVEGALPIGGEATSANTIISPKHFEEFAFPYLKEGQEKLLALGYTTTYMHICGDHNGNLPFWSQIPFGDPGIISIGHEVALETAAEYFPDHIILGNLEPAIIQTGTAEEVYEASRKIIERGKELKCGFIFSPGCEIPPMASAENVMAMTRAVNDFGWYDD
jgi:uroporphyrinogen decarboxylase